MIVNHNLTNVRLSVLTTILPSIQPLTITTLITLITPNTHHSHHSPSSPGTWPEQRLAVQTLRKTKTSWFSLHFNFELFSILSPTQSCR